MDYFRKFQHHNSPQFFQFHAYDLSEQELLLVHGAQSTTCIPFETYPMSYNYWCFDRWHCSPGGGFFRRRRFMFFD